MPQILLASEGKKANLVRAKPFVVSVNLKGKTHEEAKNHAPQRGRRRPCVGWGNGFSANSKRLCATR
jgi:protein required for attachment to host cells